MSDLVVVPTALRKSRVERRLCDAQDGLLFGPRVSTLPHLAPGLLAAAADRRTILTPLAERLLALAAARDSGLLAGAGQGSGAGRAAARLLSELRTAEVTPSDLRAAASTAPGRVGERLLAAAAALATYEDLLARRNALDAAGALRAAAVAAERGARSEETHDLGLLVLEGFLPTSRAALDLGAALAARARRVLARIPFLPEEPARSAPAEPWLRRVESLHELSVQRDLEVRFPATGAMTKGRVLRLPAPSDEAQCDAAARFAASLPDEGFAPPDVAVIAPRRILDGLPEAFARLGVPLSAPTSRPLSTVPVVRDVRAALTAAGDLDRTALLALLGSPYLGPAEPLPHLRFLLDRSGILDGRGDPAERLRARAAALTGAGPSGSERPALLRAARAVDALHGSLAPLRSPATPSEWTARVRAFVDRSGVRRRAARGDTSLARRDLAAVSRFEESLDDLASALAMAGRAADRIPRDEWVRLLELALERADLPSGQGPAEGAVEAWPLEEAPGLTSRATLVLGAERGVWPGVHRVDPLLGNAAREALQAHLGRRALPTAFHQQSDAEFRGLCAMASATDVLAVGWTQGVDREGPAMLAAQVLDAAAAPELPLSVDPPLEDARGEAEALRGAARLAGDGRAERARASLASLPDLAARADDAALRGRQERERRESWLTGVASPSAGQIPPGLAAWREVLPEQWSPTELETHAACPFKYLLRKAGIRGPGQGDLDMEPRDEGALLHAVLEGFVRARVERGAWPPGDDAADREEARRVAGELFARFEGEGRVGDPATWAARREALLRRLDRFVSVEARGDPALRPVLLEFEFGGKSGRPPIAIPADGGAILLQGRIDRVDADADRIVVVDYKNSRSSQATRKKLSAEALGSRSFQAAVYLLAAARELPGRTALSATYALLRSGERVPPWSTSPGDPFLELDLERRAAVRAEGGRTLADGVVEAVARIRSGALPVVSEDCTGCAFGAVCRFPRAGEA